MRTEVAEVVKLAQPHSFLTPKLHAADLPNRKNPTEEGLEGTRDGPDTLRERKLSSHCRESISWFSTWQSHLITVLSNKQTNSTWVNKLSSVQPCAAVIRDAWRTGNLLTRLPLSASEGPRPRSCLLQMWKHIVFAGNPLMRSSNQKDRKAWILVRYCDHYVTAPFNINVLVTSDKDQAISECYTLHPVSVLAVIANDTTALRWRSCELVFSLPWATLAAPRQQQNGSREAHTTHTISTNRYKHWEFYTSTLLLRWPA
jgi:hypothetical protein